MPDPEITTDTQTAHAAIVRRVDRRTRSSGEVEWPCAPALIDIYLNRAALLFTALGKAFSESELSQLREILLKKLREGYDTSPHNLLVLAWTPQTSQAGGIDYEVWVRYRSLESQYAGWVENKDPPLFGKNPDARVMDAARRLPPDSRILDIGAGTGRNALPLAQAGFCVDAIELTPAFAQILSSAAAERNIRLTVLQGDLFETSLDELGYDLIIASEVTSHFRALSALESFVHRCRSALKPRGQLLFNAFVSEFGYQPEAIDRELAEVLWSTLYTPEDLDRVSDGFTVVSSEDMFEYERARSKVEDWPPTGWFTGWSQGYDLYELAEHRPPMRLCWHVWQRDA